MSDTAANRMAGGPIVYIAAQSSTLPVITGATVTWSNNEVQSIIKSGTVSGGTCTLTFVHPTTGVEETTGNIAYDATAGTVQAALVALSGIGVSDVVCAGGPWPSSAVTITFQGDLANTPIDTLVVDNTAITGGGTMVVSTTANGRLWTELPDVVKDISIKYAHKAQPHQPAFSPHPTGSTTTHLGVESISFDIEESDLDAFNIGLAAALLATTPAGAGQVGTHTLTQPLPADADAGVYQLALNYKGPQGGTGWGIIDHYYAVKRNHAFDFKAGESVRTPRITFDVFASSSNSYRCHKMYEYLSAATS